jgi:hypothetical protein
MQDMHVERTVDGDVDVDGRTDGVGGGVELGHELIDVQYTCQRDTERIRYDMKVT